MRIEGCAALVTGAARGIGREFVVALLEAGASHVHAGTRTGDPVSELEALAPGRVTVHALDVTDPARVDAAARAASDVRLLVNNAGTAAFGGALSAPQELVARDIDTNYYGTLKMMRAFAPIIRDNGGGAIVNMLTIVALASMPGLSVYNASKAAAWSLTQSARSDLGSDGVAVHGVFPGAVDTEMIAGIEMPKTSPRDVARAVLQGVEADEEDIFPDDMARGLYERWREDHKRVERELASM